MPAPPFRPALDDRTLKAIREDVDRRVGTRASQANAYGQYGDAEGIFLATIDRYKRLNRRPFPSWADVHAVIVAMGYVRRLDVSAEVAAPSASAK